MKTEKLRSSTAEKYTNRQVFCVCLITLLPITHSAQSFKVLVMVIEVKKAHQMPLISSFPNVLQELMEILIICPATFLPSLGGYEEQCKIPMPLCQCNTVLKKKSKSINISIIEQLLTDTVKEVKLVIFSNYFCCRDSFTSSFETASHHQKSITCWKPK